MVSYTKCEKTFDKGRISEKRRQISVKEYYSLRDLQTPGKNIVRKKRSSFMYEHNNFVLDTFSVDGKTVSVLIIQGHKDKREIKVPDIIKKNILEEISCELMRRKNRNRH